MDRRTHTCTGLAATNRPATPPPTTRPSGLDKDTLMPPDLLRVPPISFGMNEPDKERISNSPCRKPARKMRFPPTECKMASMVKIIKCTMEQYESLCHKK